MYSKTKTVSLVGLNGYKIEVESDITSGLPAFNIVGLPDSSIKESKERIRVALINSGYKFPPGRITINLSPADLKKEGTQLDLPIAISLLSSMGVIHKFDDDLCFIGELSLDGRIVPINGALAMIISMRELGYKRFIVPDRNKKECAIIKDVDILPFENLGDLISFLNEEKSISPYKIDGDIFNDEYEKDIDFSDVKGQENIKRAFEIAAAGNHNVLIIGPPGAGKSFSAKRIPTILPKMDYQEAIECTKIYSIMGLLGNKSLITKRPFRSPHHTASNVALIGGGHSIPKPGEISLAHNGVLFLDELPEFSKKAIESLREPLENKEIHISRAATSLTYPANFILIAAMNPCPCGNYGNPLKECNCSTSEISRYLGKVSAALLDRIDMHIEVKPVKYNELVSNKKSTSSKEMRDRVTIARERQKERYKSEKINTNSQLTSKLMKKYIKLDDQLKKIAEMSFKKYKFSARSFDKILKMSLTIADIDNSDKICAKHLMEAIRYRTIEGKYWNI
ncbi:MAG: YifB family Mg chelatase-like AAA ATPase [Tissierellia bacterium]|nr:YifB family Mg chelatase-like AAA ATPase [Tissierellia bacterium]